jgi:prephenate dehydrogenase
MKVVIVGAGRMGRWLAGELSSGHNVSIYDRDPDKLKELTGTTCLASLEAIRDFRPDLLVNAVTLGNMVAAFEQVIPYLPDSCMISDIGSLKSEVADFYKGCPFPFVSVHPMFGPTFADMAKLRDCNAIIITESDPRGARFFQELFEGLGVTVFHYSFEEHDRMMAYSLSLPFLSTMVFAASLGGRSVPGTTFAKHLDVAHGLLSEDDQLLSEILFNPHTLGQLERVTGKLEYLKHILRAHDQELLGSFLQKLRDNIG